MQNVLLLESSWKATTVLWKELENLSYTTGFLNGEWKHKTIIWWKESKISPATFSLWRICYLKIIVLNHLLAYVIGSLTLVLSWVQEPKTFQTVSSVKNFAYTTKSTIKKFLAREQFISI